MNKTLAKGAAAPAKKASAKVAPVAPSAHSEPSAAARSTPAPVGNRFTDRFAPARAQVRSPDEGMGLPRAVVKADPKLVNAWKNKSAAELTEPELLAMPDSEYMNEKQREFFRLRLQAQKAGNLKSNEQIKVTEQAALAVLTEKQNMRAAAEGKAVRPLRVNVEFWTAVVLEHVGIPRELFSSTFCASRIIGWGEHVAEQIADNKLFRPLSLYTGEMPAE